MGHHPTDIDLCAFLDKELAPTEHANIEAHLASCGACKNVVSFFVNQRMMIRGIGDVDLPASFAQDTAMTVRSRFAHEKEWNAIEKTAQKVLATLVILVALLLAVSTSSSDAATEAQNIPSGVYQEYFRDSTIARVATMSKITREDVLEAALTRP